MWLTRIAARPSLCAPGVERGGHPRVRARCDCDTLREALRLIPGAQRLVVGHTIQRPMGINGVCGGRVWRVDVGMSQGCGNSQPEVLEILEDREVRVLPVVGHGTEILESPALRWAATFHPWPVPHVDVYGWIPGDRSYRGWPVPL